jgi:4-methyl-5(b-hydroxyethyl)-thiazole monophosphate biosynthesis
LFKEFIMVEIIPEVLVLLAPGFEEVEALTPVDYLRRAGIELTTASLGSDNMTVGSHGIPVRADTTLKDLIKEKRLSASHWDAVILPGGMPGAANLAESQEISAFLKEMAGAEKWICAICAAPALVLAPLGILEGKKFTCFPGMEEKVSGAIWCDDRVVVDRKAPPSSGGIITSRGAGTAGEFAVAIISSLLHEADGKRIAEKVLLK